MKKSIIFNGKEIIVKTKNYKGQEVFRYKNVWFLIENNKSSKENYIKEGFDLYLYGAPCRIDLQRLGIKLIPKFAF